MNRVTFLYQSNIIQRFFPFHWFELFEHFHEELFTRKKNYNSLVVLQMYMQPY